VEDMEPIQGNSGGTVGSGGEGLGGETIEIKIKTLDSQSYTIQVEKNVSMNGIFGKHFVVSFRVMVCTNFCDIDGERVVENRWRFLF
jgi:hypothetical protein